MTKLEPGQRGPTTRRRWMVLALAVGSALAVLVVGTLFGVLGDRDSVPPTVRSTPRPSAPVVAAPAVRASPVVPAPPPSVAPSNDPSAPREITTRGPDGTTTTIVVTSDGTVVNTTTTSAAPN